MKLEVPNMNCKHCEEKIGKSLMMLKIKYNIDLKNKTVEIADEDEEKAKKAISLAGYTVK